MSQFMTGVVIMDKMAIDFFMAAMAAVNNAAGKGGCAVVFMPTETSAALQTEVQSSPNTGGGVWTWDQIVAGGGGGSSGGVYPI